LRTGQDHGGEDKIGAVPHAKPIVGAKNRRVGGENLEGMAERKGVVKSPNAEIW